MPSVLAQKREELKAKQQALHAIFEEAGSELDLSKVTSLDGDTAAKAAEIKRRNTELAELGEEIEDLAVIEKAAIDLKGAIGDGHRAPEQKGSEPAEVKSLGQLFVESATYKQRNGNRGPASMVEGADLKVLMSTAAGWAPQNIRQPGYVPSAQAMPTLVDLVPVVPTNQAAIVFMQETTFTNNAAERAEGANNAGEAALALTPTTSTVRQIPVWIPVTQEQMDDVAGIQAYVNNRLGLMIRQRLNSEIAAGNGIAPNLAGLIGMANVGVQPLGADPVLDCLYKGMVQCQTTGAAVPNAFALHPLDYQDIRLTRTVDGIYIMGSPNEAGPARLWGLPVVTDAAVTQNTGLVGDFANFCALAQRQGVEFEITDSHAGLFIQYTLAIRASIRVAFVVYRPSAFCQCTGI